MLSNIALEGSLFMNEWKGTIQLRDVKAFVEVDFIVPSAVGYGSWQGRGNTESIIEMDTYESDIGTIVMEHISYGVNGTTFTFKGSGKPRGKLIEAFREAE